MNPTSAIISSGQCRKRLTKENQICPFLNLKKKKKKGQLRISCKLHELALTCKLMIQDFSFKTRVNVGCMIKESMLQPFIYLFIATYPNSSRVKVISSGTFYIIPYSLTPPFHKASQKLLVFFLIKGNRTDDIHQHLTDTHHIRTHISCLKRIHFDGS